MRTNLRPQSQSSQAGHPNRTLRSWSYTHLRPSQVRLELSSRGISVSATERKLSIGFPHPREDPYGSQIWKIAGAHPTGEEGESADAMVPRGQPRHAWDGRRTRNSHCPFLVAARAASRRVTGSDEQRSDSQPSIAVVTCVSLHGGQPDLPGERH